MLQFETSQQAYTCCVCRSNSMMQALDRLTVFQTLLQSCVRDLH